MYLLRYLDEERDAVFAREEAADRLATFLDGASSAKCNPEKYVHPLLHHSYVRGCTLRMEPITYQELLNALNKANARVDRARADLKKAIQSYM